ncbi:acyl-CoA thioester hydrolase/BAAT C-terminal domain-containing protein [Streptomyces sp. M10(2022)]
MMKASMQVEAGHGVPWQVAAHRTGFPRIAKAGQARGHPAGSVAIRGRNELSEQPFAHLLPSAEIPVEAARAGLLLIAGGDDAMWPSLPFAEQLAQRRRSAEATVCLIARDDAGHRPAFLARARIGVPMLPAQWHAGS